jgi:hypothetical protein
MTDYKANYLKYKFKYLKAKSQKSKEKFEGGSNVDSIVGLSVSALFAGILYYLYTENRNKAKECITELKKKSQEELLKEYEEAHLKELEKLASENMDNHDSNRLSECNSPK